MSSVDPTQAGLEQVEDFVADVHLQPALQRWETLHGTADHPTFRVTGSRRGDQDYTSQDLAAAVGSGIQRQQNWEVDLEAFDLEFVAELRQDDCVFGLRMTPEALHHRSRVVHGLASLNPTAAYAMAVMSAPEAGQVVLDPMCGTGTILIERAALCPATIIGSDYFGKPVQAARQNISAADVRAFVVRADARKLCYADENIDRVICNLPWGRRVLSEDSVEQLYREFFPEMARALKPGGRAVLLTMQKGLTERVIAQNEPLEVLHKRVISLGGLNPWIYLLHKQSSAS
ncbi:MAG: methyltransferase domain-containing protein [Armatimonadota bacterium]